MTLRAFIARLDMVGRLARRTVAVVTGETPGNKAAVVDVNLAPSYGCVAIGADLRRLRMARRFAAGHAAVVATLAGGRHALEYGAGMAGFAGDGGMGSLKREFGIAVVEIAIDLDAAVDLLSLDRRKRAKQHHDPNRDVSHRPERDCQMQYSKIGKAWARRLPSSLTGGSFPCGHVPPHPMKPAVDLEPTHSQPPQPGYWANHADRTLTYALRPRIIPLTRGKLVLAATAV